MNKTTVNHPCNNCLFLTENHLCTLKPPRLFLGYPVAMNICSEYEKKIFVKRPNILSARMIIDRMIIEPKSEQ